MFFLGRRFVNSVHWALKQTRSPTVARIADYTGCYWLSRSSKVDDLHVIWKPICHVLLVINSRP